VILCRFGFRVRKVALEEPFDVVGAQAPWTDTSLGVCFVNYLLEIR
jgi:hypothetical protein